MLVSDKRSLTEHKRKRKHSLHVRQTVSMYRTLDSDAIGLYSSLVLKVGGHVNEKDESKEHLKRAIDIAGGFQKLGRLMTVNGPKGVTRCCVHLWLKPGKKVPAEYCPDIEKATGVLCEQIRPDVNWAVVRGVKS